MRLRMRSRNEPCCAACSGGSGAAATNNILWCWLWLRMRSRGARSDHRCSVAVRHRRFPCLAGTLGDTGACPPAGANVVGVSATIVFATGRRADSELYCHVDGHLAKERLCAGLSREPPQSCRKLEAISVLHVQNRRRDPHGSWKLPVAVHRRVYHVTTHKRTQARYWP
jgi:hypothetical protein